MTKSSTNNKWWSSIKALSLSLFVLIAIIFASQKFTLRWDLTAEKRFTLTDATISLLKNLKEDVQVKVYLEGEDLPAGIKNIRNHTRDLLQDMRRVSDGKLSYEFIDVNSAKDAKEKEKKFYLNTIKEVDADFFIIHARHGQEGYDKKPDYSIFKECCKKS